MASPYVLAGRPGDRFPTHVLRGWTSLKVTRRLDALVGTFSLNLTPNDLDLGFDVVPGAPIEIRDGKDPLLVGFVDAYRSSNGPAGSSLTVTGRDQAADVVDSSGPSTPSEFLNRRADEIAEAVFDAFPKVRSELDFATRFYGARIPLFRVNPGETAWRTIERALRSRNLLAWSRPDGGVLVGGALGTPGTVRAIAPPGSVALEPLVWGENLLQVDISYTTAERFEVYVVRGQASGSDLVFGAGAAEIEGQATDPELGGRGRRLVITAEQAVTPQDAVDRARWEATFRAARSATVTATVPGFRQIRGDSSAPLWGVNQLVRIRVPPRALDNELLVNAIAMTWSEKTGRETSLELVRRDAYLPALEVAEEANPFQALLSGDGGDE